MKAGANNRVWKKIIRDELWTAQGCRCFYCTSVLKRHQTTLDHKVPQVQNGRNDRSNFVVACGLCNKTKGSMPVRAFKRIITDRSPQGFHVKLIRAVLRLNKQADKAVRRIEGCVG